MHKARRYKICRGRKGSSKRSCHYVHRNKKGQIANVVNIGRSTRQDARIKAKRRLNRYRDVGIGNLGDFPRRRR